MYDVVEIEVVDCGRNFPQPPVECRASAWLESHGDWGVTLEAGNSHDPQASVYEMGPFFYALRPVSLETRLRDQRHAP